MTSKIAKSLISISFTFLYCSILNCNSEGKKAVLKKEFTDEDKLRLERCILTLKNDSDQIVLKKAYLEIGAFLANDSARAFTLAKMEESFSTHKNTTTPITKNELKGNNKNISIRKRGSSTNVPSDTEIKRKFKQWANRQPLEAIRSMFSYYFRDSARERLFNKLWNPNELEFIFSKLKPYPKYTVAQYNVLQLGLKNATDSTEHMLATKYLLKFRDQLFQSLVTYKSRNKAKTIVTISTPELFLSSNETSIQDKSTRDSLLLDLTPTQLLKGNFLLTESQFIKNRDKIKKLNQKYLDTLLKSYNSLIAVFENSVRKNYLNGLNLESLSVSRKDLINTEGVDTGRYSKRLSLEFIGGHIQQKLNQKTGNLYLSKKIVQDVFAQYALASFANLISAKQNKHLISSDSSSMIQVEETSPEFNYPTTLDKISISNIKYFEKKYNRGSFKEVIVLKRRFDLINNTVYEEGIVHLKHQRAIPFKFRGAIPFNLINRIRYDPRIFRKIYYSFFERKLRSYSSINSPFCEYVDILLSNPIACIPFIKNGILIDSIPIEQVLAAVRLNVHSGQPIGLYSKIGLHPSYLKPIDTTVNGRKIFEKILLNKNIDIKTQDLINAFPSSLANSSYNGILSDTFTNYAEFSKQLNVMYGVTVKSEAVKRVWNRVYYRASLLPTYSEECDCIDIFCSEQENRRKNNKRLYQMGIAWQNIREQNTVLESLSPFDLIESKKQTEILPISSIYDNNRNAIVNFYASNDKGKGCLFMTTIETPKLVNDILRIYKQLFEIDSLFMQRFNIDLSNVSDHGYEYFANVIQLFNLEKSDVSSLERRLLREGFIDIEEVDTQFNISEYSESSQFVRTLELQHYLFLQEKEIVGRINAMPKKTTQLISISNKQINAIEGELGNAIAPTLADIDRQYDEIEKALNSWTVYIGFVDSRGIKTVVVMFQYGNININIEVPSSGELHISALPKMTVDPNYDLSQYDR